MGDGSGRGSGGEGTEIHVTVARVRLNPVGCHRYAAEFLERVRLPQADSPYSPVPYFLCCRSIELALKAYLLARGVLVDELSKRPIRHDLAGALEKARAERLNDVVVIDDEAESQLVRANNYYSKKGFEYFDQSRVLEGYPELPDLGVLHELAQSLVRALEPLCRRASVGQEDVSSG